MTLGCAGLSSTDRRDGCFRPAYRRPAGVRGLRATV